MRGSLGIDIRSDEVKTFNIILLGMAVLYTLLLTIFGGDAVDYLQNIVMYLFPIANTVVFKNNNWR